MNGTQRKVLATTCSSHGLIHVFELCVPPLLILIQAEFGAGDFAMGRVVMLYGLLFGLGALPAGYLVDRFGSKPLLLLCLWGASLSMLGMAASRTLPGFAAAAGLMGLFLSIYHPAGTALISHSIPLSGRVFAYHGMAGNLGVAAAAAVAGGLGARLGWRWAIAILAALGILVGLAALTLPTPSAHEIRPPRNGGRWRGLALLLVGVAFLGMVYRGLTTFLPKLFAVQYTRDLELGAAVGGTLTTAALLVGLAGMYSAGRFADRGVHPALVFLAGTLLQVPLLVGVGYAGGPALLPLVMGVAFFHFFTQPVGNQLVAEFTPPRWRGLGYGLYFFVSFGVGSLGAALGGWASERFGLARAFPVLALVLLPSVAAMLVLASAERAPVRPTRDGAGPSL